MEMSFIRNLRWIRWASDPFNENKLRLINWSYSKDINKYLNKLIWKWKTTIVFIILCVEIICYSKYSNDKKKEFNWITNWYPCSWWKCLLPQFYKIVSYIIQMQRINLTLFSTQKIFSSGLFPQCFRGNIKKTKAKIIKKSSSSINRFQKDQVE